MFHVVDDLLIFCCGDDRCAFVGFHDEYFWIFAFKIETKRAESQNFGTLPKYSAPKYNIKVVLN